MLPRARVRLLPCATALALLASAAAGDERPAALGSGRVVVAPLNLGVRAVPEVEPGLTPVWQALLALFASEHPPLVALDAAGAEELWAEVMVEAAPEDPLGRLQAARARFARRVGEQMPYDAIVFPALITRRARLVDRSVSWDGVTRTVVVPVQDYEQIEALRDGPVRISRSGARGELAAVSLHVAVFSADGSPRFEGLGGLVLLQDVAAPASAEESELVTRPRERPFADAEALREGILAAFR